VDDQLPHGHRGDRVGRRQGQLQQVAEGGAIALICAEADLLSAGE